MNLIICKKWVGFLLGVRVYVSDAIKDDAVLLLKDENAMVLPKNIYDLSIDKYGFSNDARLYDIASALLEEAGR